METPPISETDAIHAQNTSFSDSIASTFETDLDLPGGRKGKVRDVYQLPAETIEDAGLDLHGAGALVMIATDRISAFDVVMPTAIPGKGVILTSIASFWLNWIQDQGICKTHLISTDDLLIPDSVLTPTTQRRQLKGRTTIGRLCKVIPVECVVRGYLEGSGLKDYINSGSVCGVELPAGLVQCDQLPEPIFTPATKADEGHDENIGFDQAVAHLQGFEAGIDALILMQTLRERSIEIYTKASQYAQERGIILADTKFEFGLPVDGDGKIISTDPILIDEALTPDSSRFWPADSYSPGRAQASFDKQFVREYLESLVESGSWDKSTPGPAIPHDVIAGTLERYSKALELLTKPA
ncbi:MAG: phosphoribosylaminoimidazolesuccinocarboxamide synthase [Phycisphaerales bacterium]